MDEVNLFIVDPADDKRKHVGTKQIHGDGTYVWFRRITTEHVMRSGSLGVDAMTYDTQFAGKPGKFRVEVGTTVYEASFEVFERLRKEKDLGHGRQYFLAFAYWQAETAVLARPAKPTERLVFGAHVPCHNCKHKRKPDPDCGLCSGRGYVSA